LGLAAVGGGGGELGKARGFRFRTAARVGVGAGRARPLGAGRWLGDGPVIARVCRWVRAHGRIRIPAPAAGVRRATELQMLLPVVAR